MANVIKLKNSGTANSSPTSLEIGELAINYADGKIFYKNSSNTIVEFGGSSGGVTVLDTLPSSPSAGDLWFESDTGKTFVYYDSYWVEIGGGSDVGDYIAALVAGNGIVITNNSGRASTPTIAIDTSIVQARVANVSDAEIGYLNGVTSEIQTQINAKSPSASPTFTGTVTLPSDTSIGNVSSTEIGYIDGVTSAIQTQIDSKAPLANPTFTGTVSGITKTMVGLGSVDNTTDLAKPISNATQSALDLKAPLASPTFTGTVTVSNDLTVSGNVTVSGTTTTINTETLTINDNLIVLNNNASGSPSENAGIEVERGDSTNVVLRWNETTDRWQFTNDGTNFTDLGAGGATISSTAPSSPEVGSLWFDSDTAQTFVYYDSAWVEVGASAMGATVSTTAPNSPIGGQLWFNSETGGTYVYYDSAWVEVGAAPVNTILQTIDAKGDLLVGTADNTLARQAIGSNSQLLRANSSTATGVEWFTPPYAPAASPTFTGTVVLPSDTSIGNVSSTEIGYIDGVTSAIQTQLDSKLAAATAITSNRNAFINGAMNVWQRGTNTSLGLGGGGYVGPDRWWFYNNGFTSSISQQQVGSTLPQFRLCARIQRTTGQTGTAAMVLMSPQETWNSMRFAGKNATLSFYARASSGLSNPNGVQVFLNTGTGTDQSNFGAASYTGLATPIGINPTLTTSWQRFSGTAAISSTTSEVGVQINFSPTGTAGASDWFEITGIQLEEGSVVTPFEFEDFGVTLQKCQRYYQKSYNQETAPGATGVTTGVVTTGILSMASGLGFAGKTYYSTPMRVSPTVTTYSYSAGTTGVISDAGTGGDKGAGSATVIWQGANGFDVYNLSGTGITSSYGFMYHYTASAEL